jgi:signal peptidase I
MPTYNEGYMDNPYAEDLAYYTKPDDNIYNRGEIVIANVGEKDIIKRVVGLPNEKISIRLDYETYKYYVYINDVKLEEDYIYSRDDMIVEYESFIKLFGVEEITLQDNEYFLMGDNRGHSLDSTHYGVFTPDRILGRVDYSVKSNEIPFISLFIQLFLPILAD